MQTKLIWLYNFIRQGYDSIPLVNSTSWCIQTIAGHRITQLDCEEKHFLRPFSHKGSGAATTVRQLLVFLVDEPSDEDAVIKDVKRIKSSLHYEHMKTRESNSDSSISTILQRLCQNTEVRHSNSIHTSHLNFWLKIRRKVSRSKQPLLSVDW